MENLTFEEAAIVGMYRKVSREETIAAMRETRKYLEPETLEVADNAVEKLKAMTDREFAALDLTTPFDGEDASGG